MQLKGKIYCRLLNFGEHLSWQFGYVWSSRCLNSESITSGILFWYASIIFRGFDFHDSKEPRETRVIKALAKIKHSTVPINALNNEKLLAWIQNYTVKNLPKTLAEEQRQNMNYHERVDSLKSETSEKCQLIEVGNLVSLACVIPTIFTMQDLCSCPDVLQQTRSHLPI